MLAWQPTHVPHLRAAVVPSHIELLQRLRKIFISLFNLKLPRRPPFQVLHIASLLYLYQYPLILVRLSTVIRLRPYTPSSKDCTISLAKEIADCPFTPVRNKIANNSSIAIYVKGLRRNFLAGAGMVTYLYTYCWYFHRISPF